MTLLHTNPITSFGQTTYLYPTMWNALPMSSPSLRQSDGLHFNQHDTIQQVIDRYAMNPELVPDFDGNRMILGSTVAGLKQLGLLQE